MKGFLIKQFNFENRIEEINYAEWAELKKSPTIDSHTASLLQMFKNILLTKMEWNYPSSFEYFLKWN